MYSIFPGVFDIHRVGVASLESGLARKKVLPVAIRCGFSFFIAHGASGRVWEWFGSGRGGLGVVWG